MTTIDSQQISADPPTPNCASDRASSRSHVWVHVPLVLATLCTVGVAIQTRWSLASTLTMQCDELPLLTRFTGLCGRATNEAEARAFKPGLFTLRTGAIRSFRVLKGLYAIHTTTGFWTNLTIHLFGYSPAGVRAGPLFWSVVGLLAVGWAAWLVTGRLEGSCVAVVVLALSPFHTAYAAQARGYSEAMALTPLLLIAFTYLLRRPDSWVRAALTFVCALQLALTVYTMWVFWVLPALVLAVWLLPRRADPSRRQSVRTITALLLVAMLCFMSIYTAVRYTALFSAATFGERFHSLAEAVSWLGDVLRTFFVFPMLWVLPAMVGVWALWKSEQRWWCWVMVTGFGAPVALAVANGSAGYMRNLGFLIPVAALLVGVGVDALVHALRRRVGAVSLSFVTAVGILFVTTMGYRSVQASAIRLMEPDWGGLVQRLDRLPETVGRRWLCPCLANHWQIDWYRNSHRDADLLDVNVGQTIEVVMGAQHERGRPVVYRNDPYHAGIRSGPLPDYLRRVAMSALVRGIEVRRWEATRVSLADCTGGDSDAPVFMAVHLRSKPSTADWSRFLTEAGAFENGVVPFNLEPIPNGFLLTLIARRGDANQTMAGLEHYAGATPDRMRLFALSALGDVGLADALR